MLMRSVLKQSGSKVVDATINALNVDASAFVLATFWFAVDCIGAGAGAVVLTALVTIGNCLAALYMLAAYAIVQWLNLCFATDRNYMQAPLSMHGWSQFLSRDVVSNFEL